MIENDPRRSIEFFKAPVRSGEAARHMALPLSAVLALHILTAIVKSLADYFTFHAMDSTVSAEGLDPQTQQILVTVNATLELIYSSPLILAVDNFLVQLVFTTLCWQIGRAISGNPIGWLEAQSAIMRFRVVTTLVLAFCSGLLILTGAAFFSFLNLALTIYFFVILVLVWQGILGMKSAFQSLLTIVLSFMAMLGLALVVAVFIGVLI